jgi:putative ABC transport system substrate-binding protein
MQSIGFLSSVAEDQFGDDLFGAFREGLKDFHYEDGKNVTIIPKWAGGDYHQLKPLADDLVQQDVDVIATVGGLISAQAAVNATRKIPIVFVVGYNPARLMFRPRVRGLPANATGISLSTTETVPDRLAKLRLLIGNKVKVAVLLHPYDDPDPIVFNEEKKQAKKAKLQVFLDDQGLEKAFKDALGSGAGGLLVCADPYFTSQRDTIVKLAQKYNLPTAYPFRAYPDTGGLVSFGPSLRATYHEAGQYVAKILSGKKPSVKKLTADDYEHVVNKATATALGLKIPKKLRKRA